ncbi:MAG: conjugal transfer protein TraX [Clostridia bacterium]|nr:conjugal transfer protein TraX [Clostridia bacterium]
MSAFVLKIIALITMCCDHISYLLYGGFSHLNYIGRIAFPIFAFQISEGYIHTNNLKKYFLRLFVFALISQIPFMLFCSIFTKQFSLNIFFTLLLGLISIIIYDKFNKLKTENKLLHLFYNFAGILSAILMGILAEFINVDYGAFGVSIIFVFFLFKKHKFFMNIGFILCTTIYYLKNMLISNKYTLIFVFTLIPLIFINLYNNKRGKNLKYILYIFYPAHLLIFYALSLLPIFPML